MSFSDWIYRDGTGLLLAACALFALCQPQSSHADDPAGTDLRGRPVDRSPVDVAVSSDQQWLLTANQTSNTISLIRWPKATIADEAATNERPSYVLAAGSSRFFVSCTYGQCIQEWSVTDGRLKKTRQVDVAGHPVGLAMDSAGKRMYVALESEAGIAEIDLESGRVVRTIPTPRWPRFLALSPDGQRLGVSTSGDRGVTVVDLKQGKAVYTQSFVGLNIGHLQFASDGFVYFPWMVYRRNPITTGNIRLGWVLASRIGRFRLDKDERREALSLDPPGKAIADPFGMAVDADAQTMVVSAAGTHELLVYDIPSLPFDALTGPDHLPQSLRNAPEKFDRIELGGRPMGLRMLNDQNTVVVANYLANSIQVVDVKRRAIVKTIGLGGPKTPSLARRGEAIFYDGRRSLDQWYSCHSCHQDGGSNAVAMDTFNDDSAGSFKTVLPLYGVVATEPWTWHGWQTDLRAAMQKSITSTMIGKKPSDEDVDALIAYLGSIEPPPKVRRETTVGEQRGKALFHSIGCAECHQGARFTDGKVHEVGLESRRDRYRGFNTPTLLGVGRKVKWLHDGRAKSLQSVLQEWHKPSDLVGRKLSDKDLADLIAYLRRL